MRRLTMLVAVLALLVPTAAMANALVYEEDFADGLGDWQGLEGDEIVHVPADETAEVSGYAFSFFGKGGYDFTWPEHGYIAEIDVFLDPAVLGPGDGFDYTVASASQESESEDPDERHLRDFIFHVGVHTDGRLLVNANNNSSFEVVDSVLENGSDDPPAEVTEAGWYTLQHVFRDQDGSLAVDLRLLDDDGDELFTTTRHNADDTIADRVGGTAYGWFTFADGTFTIDDHRLEEVVPTPGTRDDCRDGGFADFGFDNQGRCIASVQANEASAR